MRFAILFSCSVLLSCQQKVADTTVDITTPTAEVSIEEVLPADSNALAERITEPIKETVPVVGVTVVANRVPADPANEGVVAGHPDQLVVLVVAGQRVRERAALHGFEIGYGVDIAKAVV